MSNRRYTQFYYTSHNYPVQLDCNFNVTPTNGAGVTNLVGAGIQNVYMHTSTTPVSGNPNPAAGYMLVQLQDCFNGLYSVRSKIQSPLSGSALTSTTANATYVISALGTATLAQWQAKGLPVGITPAVGVPFVASASGTIGGSAAVQAVVPSGVGSIEIVGDPNTTLISNASSKAQIMGVQSGAYLMLVCYGPTDATTTTLIPTAPAAGSKVFLEFYLSNSRIKVQGE